MCQICQLKYSFRLRVSNWHICTLIYLLLFILLFESFQSVFKELYIFRYIFVEGVRRAERFTFVIQQNVERLRIGSELASLEITPFVTDRFQFTDFTVFFYFYRFGQLSSTIRVIST